MPKHFASARFCPWCGTESLKRDDYHLTHPSNRQKPNPTSVPPEYVCLTCSVGFRLSASRRHEAANDLFAEHRRMRNGRG